MTGKTHIVGGIAACAAIEQFTGIHGVEAATFMVAGACGAILPDICHAGSKIGRRFPLLARTISLIFGHRTVTHSLLFMVVVGALLFSYASNYPAVRDGILIGMISHLFLDALTVNGIKLLWPSHQRIRLPFYTRTGSVVEYVLFVLFTAAIFLMGGAALAQIKAILYKL